MKAPNQRIEAVQHALNIEGWMFQSELETLFDWASEMESVVEIGSWKGRSTYVLAKGCKGTVTAVDTFQGSPDDAEHLRRVKAAGGSTLREFLENTSDCPNRVVNVCHSLTAAGSLPDVDMVFIDGGHTYAEVLSDLQAWLPKARKLICGHDWQHEPVQRAVREVLGDVEVGAGSLWFKRLDVVKPKLPLFSILHTSARPGKWRAVYDDWMSKAVRPEDVEYVLCVDPRWGFSTDPQSWLPSQMGGLPYDNLHVVQNTGRRCYVDGAKIAAEASTGSILIVNADDQFACDGWDLKLTVALDGDILDGEVGRRNPPSDFYNLGLRWSFVIEVSTGTPDEHWRGIMVMPVLSRARYEQQGYVFYPEYESMYADNDFCETARKDGVVIDARHLMFPHRHVMFNERGEWSWQDWAQHADLAYQAQNRPEASALGLEVFKRRTRSGFPPMQRGVSKRFIALCLSGEQFQGPWVDALLTLYGHLIDLDFSIMRVRSLGDNTNVYEMREGIRRAVLNSDVRPDLCLWLDDDNTLTPSQFDKLLAGLDSHPEVDGVSGWCWIHNRQKQGFMVSCGEWAPDHLHWMPFATSFVHEQELKPFECGGFPVLLMRTAALDKAGDGCFLPIIDNRLEHGLTGEDISFFLNADKAGCTFLVDPTVRVPHLKYVEVEPVFPEEGKVPVKVACMIRAKNEGRWLGRTIESVKALCGSDIYVMEDGSTDDTVAVALAAGAVVLPSPFVGQGFNEVRDKDWLLEHVKRACNPDWILMPDGDEELEVGACEKILRVLEKNPPVDCFALRFLFLWDSIDTVRLDGVYGKMQRQSLFRAKSDLKFRSFYQGPGENGNHCSLHCSNAPGLGGMRIAPLNVFLLHYGYLHREDRIRKYQWIIGLDPHNEAEGFYLHTVQGDISDVPPNAVLKHGGPLRLEKLPGRMVPKFDVVPGPWSPDTVREYASAD